ncbi:AB-hydrolase YheT [Terfezia boudieri ATCC MYA-4762]|uniref:alcohol O-acetyltransferase n=1 Tax=Terfezia boudieri ATCC MYA-4762 TaxID=1051890 RepID=A0A3N4LR40_9PEZI|nr:AB-hydrolase YheT [Terfezia boudieri ATCC MYA-4762]
MGIPKFGWPTAQECFHAAKTVGLKLRSGGVVQFSELARTTLTPFRAHPLLPNGHLQTFWTVATGADIPLYYGRKIMVAKDGGTYTLDFVVLPSEAHTAPGLWHRTRYLSKEEQDSLASEDSKPMLLALHGLTGGSHELYLRAVLAPLVERYGWAACVMNARGCAKSKITTHQLFNARVTTDVRETVEFLRKTFPNRPLYGVGFSLGANIFANYLGEEGDSCVLKSAALCSNPWNLEMTNAALHRSWLGAEVYSKAMGKSLKGLFEDQYEVLANDPKIDVELVRKSKYIWEFDRDLTSRVFGYATVGAYYRDASSVDRLLNIRIPTFIVHAEDDPIALKDGIPYDEVKSNPYAFLVQTSHGGHLSWFEMNGERWFARTVIEYFRKMQDKVEEVLPIKLEDQIKAKL